MSELKELIIQTAISNKELSGYDIASMYGCSQAYVSETLKFAGVENGFRIEWESWDSYIKELFEQDFGYKEVAEKTGIKYETLRYHCIRTGILPKDKRKKEDDDKREVIKVWDDFKGKYMFDVTDFFIDRPCKQKVPEWKKNYQREGTMFYGLKEV